MSNNSSPTKVGIKKGTFYLSQDKDGGQGWEKQEFKNPQTGEDMIKYHKNISVEGELVYVGLKEDKFKGNCMSVLVKGESETFSLEIPVLDTKGVKATNQYFNSLVGALETLDKGAKIKMFVNNKNEDKDGNLYKNIVVLREDNSLVKSNFQFSEVPKWETTKGVDDFGKETNVYNPRPTNKFYIDKLLALAERYKKQGETNNPTPAPQPTQGSTPPRSNAQPAQNQEVDDLPF
jgi:hypothetical protein